jgi:hypothetical protein
MITASDFRQVSDDRMRDCQALLAAGRYDAIMYLSGYVLEAALKACICDTLGWEGFPGAKENGHRFVRPMMVHDLGLLLHYSGRESFVLSQLQSEWSNVAQDWTTEIRYAPNQNVNREKAEQRLVDIERLRRAL